MNKNPSLILVSGLSNSGKSSFADFYENHIEGSTHIPLDKYFHSVPKNSTFLDWVQLPESIDWELLLTHIRILNEGKECYTPCIDAWGTGQRLSNGGMNYHPKSRLMKPSTEFYIIPGCLAFHLPKTELQNVKIFMNTPLQIVASRHEKKDVSIKEVKTVLTKKLTENYTNILKLEKFSDFSFDGNATDLQRKMYCETITIFFQNIKDKRITNPPVYFWGGSRTSFCQLKQ